MWAYNIATRRGPIRESDRTVTLTHCCVGDYVWQ